jgi:hypothetical protein
MLLEVKIERLIAEMLEGNWRNSGISDAGITNAAAGSIYELAATNFVFLSHVFNNLRRAKACFQLL